MEAAALKEILAIDPDLKLDEPVPLFTWERSPNHSSRGGAARDTIVIHATAGGSTAGAVATLKDPRREASAHIVIPDDRRAGEPKKTVRMVPDDRAAWHCRPLLFQGRMGMNSRSFGIEVVNTCKTDDPYSDWQVHETAAWCRYWMSENPIRWIVTHAYVDPSRRRDPCVTFPWKIFTGLVTRSLKLPEEREKPIRVSVFGQEVDAAAFIEDGSMYVQVRPLLEAAQLQVVWDAATRSLKVDRP